MIINQPISQLGSPDRLIWTHTSHGGFSVQSAYNMAMLHKRCNLHRTEGSDTGSKEKIMWQRTWNLNVKEKIRLFLWKCYNSILPTSENLIRRGCQIDEICRICGEEPETEEHLFFPTSRAIITMKRPGKIMG